MDNENAQNGFRSEASEPLTSNVERQTTPEQARVAKRKHNLSICEGVRDLIDNKAFKSLKEAKKVEMFNCLKESDLQYRWERKIVEVEDTSFCPESTKRVFSLFDDTCVSFSDQYNKITRKRMVSKMILVKYPKDKREYETDLAVLKKTLNPRETTRLPPLMNDTISDVIVSETTDSCDIGSIAHCQESSTTEMTVDVDALIESHETFDMFEDTLFDKLNTFESVMAYLLKDFFEVSCLRCVDDNNNEISTEPDNFNQWTRETTDTIINYSPLNQNVINTSLSVSAALERIAARFVKDGSPTGVSPTEIAIQNPKSTSKSWIVKVPYNPNVIATNIDHNRARELISGLADEISKELTYYKQTIAKTTTETTNVGLVPDAEELIDSILEEEPVTDTTTESTTVVDTTTESGRTKRTRIATFEETPREIIVLPPEPTDEDDDTVIAQNYSISPPVIDQVDPPVTDNIDDNATEETTNDKSTTKPVKASPANRRRHRQREHRRRPKRG